MAETKTCVSCHKILKPRERYGLHENLCFVCSRNQQNGKREQYEGKTQAKRASPAGPRRGKTAESKTTLRRLNVLQLSELLDQSRNSVDNLEAIGNELIRRKTKAAGTLLKKVNERLVKLGAKEILRSKRPSRITRRNSAVVSKAREPSNRKVSPERKSTKFPKSFLLGLVK